MPLARSDLDGQGRRASEDLGGHDRGPRKDAGGRGIPLHVDDVLRDSSAQARSCASLIRPLRRTNETGLSRKREHLSRAASDQGTGGHADYGGDDRAFRR
jgi:hypothetical protein